MHFAFKWKHRDGSSIRFSPEGWHSDDPAKARWLNQESELLSSWPVIPAGIRAWLQPNRELIEFRAIVQ
jgi:hypothetical protein